MKITFLGAAKTVTGSNILVEAAGKKFLVDCGMYQGKIEEEFDNADPFLYDVNEIDFMLLTHAHIDHSGRIPKLYNEGFRNSVYATKATCDLCSIMLPDSGHIQEMESDYEECLADIKKNYKMKRENICEYENYESPWLEVIEVEVEKGFNASTEGLDDEELL